jgi:hypothetical protein
MVAAIALVEILVGYAQVAVVGKRPPKSTFARNDKCRNALAKSLLKPTALQVVVEFPADMIR